MKCVLKFINSGEKRNRSYSILAVFTVLTIAVLTVMPVQATAAEADGTYVIVIGAPGSGKTTVSEYIRESEGVPIIEVGQLLTDEIAAASRSTAVGRPGTQRTRSASRRQRNIERAREQLEAGELVESQAVDTVVAVSILSPTAIGGFVLDGYPGTWTQAEFLDGLLAARGIVPIVLYLDISDEVAMERMRARGRVDDQSGFSATRLEIFRNNMAPLLDFYADSGLFTIDASGSIAEVRELVGEVLNNN
jgi:adenylate kinase